jgi:serine/threonine protein kinase
MRNTLSSRLIRFGPFELDTRTGELHKEGRKILLQEQPFQLLKMLVSNAGQLLTREEIRRSLWPNDTVVEFDRSINAVVKKLRMALGDSAEEPTLIETVARRGYRLIVQAERVNDSSTDPESEHVALEPSASLTGKKISHYRILEILAGGGMGIVYRAEDLKLGRNVAMKFLPEELVSDTNARERFEREARAASSLDHRNICPIYEFGEHDGQHFLVMPFLQGKTVRDRLTDPAPLPIDELVDLAIQITEGLEAAHRSSIIHRDVKPANVFITSNGEVKLLDFGLARLEAAAEPVTPKRDVESRTNPNLTRTGVTLGTAAYMSPEQVRGEKLDSRTDLFSFGLVLYEMATRTQAFIGETAPAIRDAIVNRIPVPARQINPEIPQQLDTIIARALQKDRGLRYQTAPEIRADLLALKRVTSTSLRVGRWWLRLSIAAAFTFAIVAAWSVRSRNESVRRELKQTQLTANSSDNPVEGGAISPDGKYLAYVDLQGIHIRLLETGETHNVPKPETLEDRRLDWDIKPWSDTRFLATAFLPGQPDSTWIVSVMGGPPRKLRDGAAGHAVSADGSLVVFTTRPGKVGYREIWLMGGSGEEPRKLFETDDDSGFRFVRFSPDRRRVAYMKEHRVGDRMALTLETRDLNDGSLSVVFSGAPLWLYTWVPDGRIIYALGKPDINALTCDIWEARLDGKTGKLVGERVRLTNWGGVCVGGITATADSKRLVFNKWWAQRSVYVADVLSGGKHITTPRRLSMSDGQEFPAGWSSDSRAIVFVSNRQGTWGIFKQSPGEPEATSLITGLRGSVDARLTPDGGSIVWQEFTSLTAGRVVRMPLAGGKPEPILTLSTAPNESPWVGGRSQEPLRCSNSPATVCAIGERSADGQHLVFSAFDPTNARRREQIQLAIDPKAAYKWDLSPDGTRIAILRRSDQEIEVVPLHGEGPHRITVKGWKSLETLDWAADGKGFYASGPLDGDSVLLYIDLKGNASILWKRPGEEEGLSDVYAIPSRDGRRLAIFGWTSNSNMWMMENF